jgi:hypothetical protein
MAEEPFAETVDKVNGRRIRRLGPQGCYGWFVEKRGMDLENGYWPVWAKFPTLEEAREEATRLGPLPDRQKV